MTEDRDPVAETISSYEASADHYAATRFGFGNDFKELIDYFIKSLPGKRVLEIGCGPGRDSKYLSEKGFDVTALDLTKSFLKIASKNAPKAKVVLMDMRHLDFPEKSFDGIWAAASFIHIPKLEAKKTLMGFRKVLTKEGFMFISVKQGSGEKFFKRDIYNGHERFFTFYTKTEVEELLQSCGFEINRTGIQVADNGTWIAVFAVRK
jgi:ubiquinone/menaquinone biosynthesis C-methylase UbiE